MVIFHSYVSLPEGMFYGGSILGWTGELPAVELGGTAFCAHLMLLGRTVNSSFYMQGSLEKTCANLELELESEQCDWMFLITSKIKNRGLNYASFNGLYVQPRQMYIHIYIYDTYYVDI